MAGIILSLAVVVAITAMVQTGIGLVGALQVPSWLRYSKQVMGYDLSNWRFRPALSWLHNRPASIWGRILRCWGLVGLGNLIGSLIVAFLVAVSLTGNFQIQMQ